MKEKCFNKSSVFKKEKESFEEFEKLDELLLDDIEEAPGLGCTSPEVNKSVHNQSKTIASAPIEQTTLVNVIFVIIVLLIVIFCYSVKVIFFKILCIGFYCPVKGININFLQENGKYYEDVKSDRKFE